MDWRLQGAGLTVAIVLTSLPVLFAPSYNASLAAITSSWSNLSSEMEYLTIASLIFVALGTVWRGPIGRASAWLQMFVSFGLGCWTLWVLMWVDFVSIDFAAPAPATAPAQTVLEIGLLIPTLSFASSLAWLFWDGRLRARAGAELSSAEILRKQIGETSQSLVSSIVTPLMLIFGIWLLFATSFGFLQVVAAGLIGLSILVFLLEISGKKRPE